jgi:hypothetical protein
MSALSDCGGTSCKGACADGFLQPFPPTNYKFPWFALAPQKLSETRRSHQPINSILSLSLLFGLEVVPTVKSEYGNEYRRKTLVLKGYIQRLMGKKKSFEGLHLVLSLGHRSI